MGGVHARGVYYLPFGPEKTGTHAIERREALDRKKAERKILLSQFISKDRSTFVA